jgi:hypothetical protein
MPPSSSSPRTPTSAKPTSGEVGQFSQSLPEGSYGRRNRQATAARETRLATRLRAVEYAYRTAVERDTAHTPPEPVGLRSPRPVADMQIDLEAEP